MLSCATIEDDLDFEEYMEDKAEEREYLMRYGQAQVAAPPPPRSARRDSQELQSICMRAFAKDHRR